MSDIKSRSKVSKNNSTKRRRNKKRRTADSSSSESDSDVSIGSDSDNEKEVAAVQTEVLTSTVNEEITNDDIKLSDNEGEDDNDADLDMDTGDSVKKYESHKRMNEIKLSDNLQEINGSVYNNTQTISDYNKATSTLDKMDKDLKNQFLQMTFEHYGEDINKLREASDFTNKSLVILANTLKEGSRMFDRDSLKSLLE